MKKIIATALIGFAALAGGTAAHAQFGGFGVKVGGGVATIADDLATKSPVPALNVGGYIDFTFAKSQSVLAEIFYLQGGINLIHRGGNFEEVHEYANDLMVRTGSYHSWYAQIPILAGVHMELPIRQAGHVVGLFVGPAFNIGLFGKYSDRKVTPYNPSYLANYDIDVNGTSADRAVFNHINRFDVCAVLGLSYEYRQFTFTLFIENGFIATSEGNDVLSLIGSGSTGSIGEYPAEIINHWPELADAEANTGSSDVSVKIPNGNNFAVMLSVAYRLGSFSK